MLAELERRGAAQQLRCRPRTDGGEIATNQVRRPLRQRAGLVEAGAVDASGAFEHTGIAQDDAAASRRGDGEPQRNRRRDAERARARDDEHRQRSENPDVDAAVDAVQDARDDGNRHGRRQELAGKPIRQPLHRTLCAARLLQHFLDARRGAVRRRPRHPHFEAAVDAAGASGDGAARSMRDQSRFAGHQSLVHRALAPQHGAVGREHLAGDDAHDIARHQRGDRTVDQPPVLHQCRTRRRRQQVGANRPARVGARSRLEVAAERDEQQHHHRGIEVDRRRADHRVMYRQRERRYCPEQHQRVGLGATRPAAGGEGTQDRPAEQEQHRQREAHRQPAQHVVQRAVDRRLRAVDERRVALHARHHHVHGEKDRQTESNDERRRVPVLAARPRHLMREQAAVTAEAVRDAIDLGDDDATAERQGAVVAEHGELSAFSDQESVGPRGARCDESSCRTHADLPPPTLLGRDCRFSPVHVLVRVPVHDQCPNSAGNSVYEYGYEYVYGYECSFPDSPPRRG